MKKAEMIEMDFTKMGEVNDEVLTKWLEQLKGMIEKQKMRESDYKSYRVLKMLKGIVEGEIIERGELPF